MRHATPRHLPIPERACPGVGVVIWLPRPLSTRRSRGKQLIAKPGTSRRYQVPADAARTIAALIVLRDQVISPILAGVRSPRPGRKPATWTPIDRDYEALRINMQTLFRDLGITAHAAAAA